MISNSVSRQTFPAVNPQLSYPFVISHFENDSINIFQVYLDGVLLAPIADYGITETAAVDGIAPGGSIVFTAQPGAGLDILIKQWKRLTID
jgi:hypothetical protein